MKANDVLKVQKEYDFLSFPRVVGNPYQDIVLNPNSYWIFFKYNYASRICFTSHNSYPKWNGNSEPTVTRMGKLFFDFDHKKKPENALRDCKRIAKFLDNENIPNASTFSGNKGFHDYLFLKRTNRKINDGLWNKIIGLHAWFKFKGEKSRVPTYNEETKKTSKGRPWLSTLDSKVAEPKRLCRIPLSRYVSMKDEGDFVTSKYHCLPLPHNDLYDVDFNSIRENSINPVISHGYKSEGVSLDLNQLIDHFDIDIKYWSMINRNESRSGGFEPANYDGVPNDNFMRMIAQMIPKPCIHADLFSDNPQHITRMTTVVHLKQAKWTLNEIIDLFDQMSDKFQWADRFNRKRRNYQISHIYNRRTSVGGYWHTSCKSLKSKHHLCVGKKCPEWFETEADGGKEK